MIRSLARLIPRRNVAHFRETSSTSQVSDADKKKPYLELKSDLWLQTSGLSKHLAELREELGPLQAKSSEEDQVYLLKRIYEKLSGETLSENSLKGRPTADIKENIT